jgi:hypothetical protein
VPEDKTAHAHKREYSDQYIVTVPCREICALVTENPSNQCAPPKLVEVRIALMLDRELIPFLLEPLEPFYGNAR